MPQGVEVGIGIIKLQPSSFDGKALGTKIGREISDGVNSSVGGGGGAIEKTAIAQGEKAGKGFGKGMSGALTTFVSGAAFAGIVAFGKKAFDAASDLNESTSKAQVVFEDAFSVVDDQAKNAAKSLGMSQQQALEAAGTFGNLFRAMGIGVDTSADMSTNLIQLGSDLASFNNANPDDVLLALKSGLVGETEPLRQFGVNLNEARIEAEALRLGLTKGNVNMVDVEAKQVAVRKATEAQAKALKEGGANSQKYKDATVAVATAQQSLNKEMKGSKPVLDASQKAQAAYSLILQDTSLAQGDYERTAEGAANKQRTLGAQWDDFTAKVGQFLLPVGQTVIGVATAALEGLSSWVETNGPKVSKWFADTFGTDPGANFRTGLDLIDQKLNEVFGEDKVTNFQTGLDGLATKLDEVFGEDKAASLTTGAITLGQTWDQVFADFEKGAIRVSETTGPIFERIGTELLWLKDNALDPLFGTFETLFGKLVEMTAEHWWDWSPIAILKDDVLDPLIGALQTVIDKIKEVFEFGQKFTPANIAGNAGETLAGLLGFAAGGVVPGRTGTPRIILAHGGETVLPTHRPEWAGMRGAQLAGASVSAAAPHQSMSFGDINVTGVTQPWETAFAVRTELRRASYLGGGR